ncbi:MFS transporter [Microbispora bryophytorum]|uniref:MFS transporter n=1 Tax=Microbispora bryophytorum TaxID=1460882 RepID=UPI0033E2D3B4
MTTDSSTTRRQPGARDPDPRRWAALTVISLATLMVVLDASVVNIALPHAQRELGIADADRQWMVTAYTLAFGGLLLLGGRIADFAGRKRVFLIGLVGFAAVSVLGGLAPNGLTLFAARALQGVFAALLAPAALSLISVTFTDPRERAKAFGVYGALQGGGGAVGLILGGVLTQYADWRWCLFINTPIALVAALAAVPAIRASRAEGGRHYDIPGAVLVTGGLVALVYGFTEAAEDAGRHIGAVLALLTAAVVLLVAFVAVERRAAHPLLPLRVVRHRDRAGSLLASLLTGAGMFGMLLFLTYYLQVDLGYTPLQAGLAFLPFSGGIVAASVLGAGLVTRLGPKVPMVGGIAVAAAGMLWLATLNGSSTYLAGILGPQILTALGLGLFFLALPTIVLSSVESRDAGVASATINTTQQIGGALGPALLNTLYVAALNSTLAGRRSASGQWIQAVPADSYLHGYRAAFLAAGGLFVLALVIVAVMVTRSGASTGASTEASGTR